MQSPGRASGDRWAFHVLEPWQFEQLAATVLEDKYGVQLLSFSAAGGRDGGRDAAARGASIRLGPGKTLHDQNVVVQAKHTKRVGATLDDGLRRRLFKHEVKKAKKLVSEGQLDVYMVVLNYALPAGQEGKVARAFGAVGVRHVVVVGRETLKRWIQQSRQLARRVPDMYGVGGPGVRQISLRAASGVTSIKKDLKGVLDRLGDTQVETGDQLCELSRQQTLTLSQLDQSQALLQEVRQEVLAGQQGYMSPLMTRDLEEVRGKLTGLTDGVDRTARAVDAIRRRLDYGTISNAKVSPHVCSKPLAGSVNQTSHDKKAPCEEEVSDSDLLLLVAHYGVTQGWRFLVRHLGLSETQVSECNAAHVSPREQAYQALRAWREGASPSDSRQKLETALRACHLNGPADDLIKT